MDPSTPFRTVTFMSLERTIYPQTDNNRLDDDSDNMTHWIPLGVCIYIPRGESPFQVGLGIVQRNSLPKRNSFGSCRIPKPIVNLRSTWIWTVAITVLKRFFKIKSRCHNHFGHIQVFSNRFTNFFTAIHIENYGLLSIKWHYTVGDLDDMDQECVFLPSSNVLDSRLIKFLVPMLMTFKEKIDTT